jgi:hypothetical protein
MRGKDLTATVAATAALVTVTVLMCLAFVPRAEAFIYWSGYGIGHADLDGSNPVTDFVGESAGCGVASDNNHLYWSRPAYSPPPYFIGRANLPDGTGVDPSFISLSKNPGGVAIDGAHVYWTNWDFPGASDAIGRADLDGSNVDENFIPTGDHPEGVAVGGGHIYWTIGDGDSDGDPYTDHNRTIERADLNGSNVDPSFLDPSTTFPLGMAVSATHIFWTATAGFPGDRIGRAELNGAEIDESFITGASDPWGLAVDEAHLYWANTGSSTIARANLDGSNVDQDIIPGLYYACGLAVDALSTPPPPPASPASPAAPASELKKKAAIKKCKKKHSKQVRKKCRKKAKKLPG